MRVVFMGTPDIAATCLKKILADGFDVVGVYTQPDRPKGRGMKLVASPVKEVAVAAGIPVFQPENFREDASVEALRALQPDICAVVAYGRILPQKVLDVPKYGCINIHASLLPKYRGSAPYQWAVLDGLTETGVTAMYLTREMDAGDIIDVSKTPIGENETAGGLLDHLAVLGAELEIPTIDGKVKYTLPEGTQSGTTFRLKGKGIPSINGRGRGDQYVTVYIETPKNLNKEQKEALKKFAETMGESNYEEQKKFFKKFKK